MNYLEHQYENFLRSAFPRGAVGELQRRCMRQAFYAGVLSARMGSYETVSEELQQFIAELLESDPS